MKNRHILAIALTLIAITCGAQPTHPNNIREKLNAFVASKEYNVQKTGSSKDGVNVYQFAQQFVMEEEPAGDFNGPLFTPRLPSRWHSTTTRISASFLLKNLTGSSMPCC